MLTSTKYNMIDDPTTMETKYLFKYLFYVIEVDSVISLKFPFIIRFDDNFLNLALT